MFSTQSDNCIPICPYFDIISLVAFELKEPKIGKLGKGLKKKKMISQKTWPLWETYFPLWYKVKSLNTFGSLPFNTSLTKTSCFH